MGRHKLPSNVKKLKSTYRQHRENTNEPNPSRPLGDPPACLDDHQKDTWREISALVPAGVLTDADRIILEVATRLLSELRTKGRLSVGKMGHLIGTLARMGLTPSDRSKVSIPGAKPKDDWENFNG